MIHVPKNIRSNVDMAMECRCISLAEVLAAESTSAFFNYDLSQSMTKEDDWSLCAIIKLFFCVKFLEKGLDMVQNSVPKSCF